VNTAYAFKYLAGSASNFRLHPPQPKYKVCPLSSLV